MGEGGGAYRLNTTSARSVQRRIRPCPEYFLKHILSETVVSRYRRLDVKKTLVPLLSAVFIGSLLLSGCAGPTESQPDAARPEAQASSRSQQLPTLPADGGEQAMFRGNLQHTGVYDTEGVTQLGGLKWKFQTKGRVASSPAIADGVAYFGSNDRHLYAVDIQTGQEKWSFAVDAQVHSSPAIYGGVVYFGSSDGQLYAVNAGTDRKSGGSEPQTR